jgi:phospholipid/cholesterol/gamma-HCH transport system substrate-binding protein
MVNGYKIGEVLDIELSDDGTNSLIVELGVNTNVDVFEGTTASLQSNIIGDMSIELHLRNGGGLVNNGAELPVFQENNIFVVLEEQAGPAIKRAEELIDNLQRTSGAIDTNKVIEMKADLRRTVAYLKLISKDVTVIMDTLKFKGKETSTGVTTLTSNGKRLYGEEVTPLMRRIAGITKKIEVLDLEPLKTSVGDLDVNLRITANILDTKDNTAGLLINSTELQDAIAQDTAHLSDLIRHMKQEKKHFTRL